MKSQVGYLPDDVGFYEDLTGTGQNLRYTAELNRLPRQAADERIDGLLDDVGLTDAADREVGGYSRGMRQRLGLADALVKDPSILILDEPTVNIDPEGVRELLLLVERLRTDQGVTVLLSSHLLHQVEQVCDRIGIFVKGRLVAVGHGRRAGRRPRRPLGVHGRHHRASTPDAAVARGPRRHRRHARRGPLAGGRRPRRPRRAGDAPSSTPAAASPI